MTARLAQIGLAFVDVEARRVEIHRQPTARGYQDVQLPEPDTRFAPLAFPDVAVTLADLLG